MSTILLFGLATIAATLGYWVIVPEKPLRYDEVPSAELDRHVRNLLGQSLSGSVLEIRAGDIALTVEKLDTQPSSVAVVTRWSPGLSSDLKEESANQNPRQRWAGEFSSQVEAARVVRSAFLNQLGFEVDEYELEYRATIDTSAALKGLREQWKASRRK